MRKEKVRKKTNRFNDILEIPKEISTHEPKITVIGFGQMLIENYKGILEYEDFFVKINTYIGIININGFNLKLNEINSDDIMITGQIENIDIERIVD